MSARVYDDHAWTGRTGYLEGCLLLERGGLIELGIDAGVWGYFITDPGFALLVECGYDPDDEATEAAAPLLTGALEVLEGEHATVEEALRDPVMLERWRNRHDPAHSVS